MKRLLLIPLLLGLLISNSVLAGRPNKRLEAAKEQLKENILNCNEAELYSACNKIPKSSWNKITNEQFVKSKKLDARRVLTNALLIKIYGIAIKFQEIITLKNIDLNLIGLKMT